MKYILRKTLAMLLSALVFFSFASVSLAAEEYTVEDAYNEFCEAFPDFVANIKGTPDHVTDEMLINYVDGLYQSLIHNDSLTEENFEEYVKDIVLESFNKRENIRIRNALTSAYPEAAMEAMEGRISPEFQPMVDMIKSLIFEHKMFDFIEEETTQSTEKQTEPNTEATAATNPTEPATEATAATTPTEPSSENASGTTEPSSEGASGATEPKSEPTASTTTPSGGAGSAGGDEGDTSDASTPSGGTDTVTPTAPPTGEVQELKFKDMSSAAWAEEAVYALVKMGIISGYGDGTFLPNNSITRAEFAKIIVMASGRYDKDAKADFKDVKESDWYYSYVASAKNLGLVNGRGDGSFDPNAKITRADICTIVYRYIASIEFEFGKDVKDASFADFNSIPEYARDAVSALSAAGIVSGMGDNKFEPNTNATRAQSARIVYGAIQKVFN